ncbi:HNH endonuclease [Leptospira bandrabouensis]|uniref:HNH endonuclease n=1 Tax=Leptospira bandrabouensis TaxID=2484903 RepID=UPI001EEBCEF0|nr:HNH endonuclease [Leptospira bandrabouensis]MCG6154152.1 HNH endonuclease [Leptospira bandrabouensis]
MRICYICNNEINERNQSKEHILPNSIGGRLKSLDLLCRTCNSDFGAKSDAELARQLNFICNVLNIEREQGEPQPIIVENKKTGEKFKVTSDGQYQLKDPKVIQELNGEQVNINIEARTIKEAKQILISLKKKYPKLNVDELLDKAINIEKEFIEPIQAELIVGGKEIFLSILKTALNYYIYKTKKIEAVKKAIEQLKENNSNLVEPIILENFLYDVEESEINHSIFLHGNQKEKKLYAIIEHFNIYHYIVKLSDEYYDEDISLLYVYDTISKIEIPKKIKFNYLPSFIFQYTYSNSDPLFHILQGRVDRIMKIAEKRNFDELVSRLTGSVWKNTVDKIIPQGEPITEEALRLFSSEIANKLSRYINLTKDKK